MIFDALNKDGIPHNAVFNKCHTPVWQASNTCAVISERLNKYRNCPSHVTNPFKVITSF
jgi:hypothetical protein